MEGIKAWACVLCVVAVGCAMLQMLAPKDGLGRIFRLIIAAFFLCCMLAPLLSLRDIPQLNLDLLPESVSADLLQQRVNEQLTRQMNAALLQVANQTLNGYGIEVQKVEVNTDTSENGSIYIKQVILFLDKQNIGNAVAARQKMSERLGMDVIIQAAPE